MIQQRYSCLKCMKVVLINLQYVHTYEVQCDISVHGCDVH